MCQCFTIGGPFISEDPDCPLHGDEAKAAEKRRSQEQEDHQDHQAQIDALTQRVAALEAELAKLKKTL